MKTQLASAVRTLALCVLCTVATASSLDEGEIARIRSGIHVIMEAFRQGDAQKVLDSTHSAAYSLYGGKEAFENASRQAIGELSRSGVKIVTTEVGKPSALLRAGPEDICFVATIMVLEIQGKRAKHTGFMVAVRQPGAGWKYLDGAAFKENSELLYTLFPQLPRAIDLPPVTVEML